MRNMEICILVKHICGEYYKKYIDYSITTLYIQLLLGKPKAQKE